jgi:acylphosphatase
MTDERLHAIVRGQVQGVNFRMYTLMKGEELGVNGWVRNRVDGSVEVVAEGIRPTLVLLLAWLHEGSPSAQVDSVDAEWLAATGEFDGFNVL